MRRVGHERLLLVHRALYRPQRQAGEQMYPPPTASASPAMAPTDQDESQPANRLLLGFDAAADHHYRTALSVGGDRHDVQADILAARRL